MVLNRFPFVTLIVAFVFALLPVGLEAQPLDSEPKARKDFSWVNAIPEPRRKHLKLPDGLEHHTFESPSMEIEVGYCVYLPDAYGENKETKFPLVLHLHGGRPGSEIKSIRLAKFVDDAIRNEDIQPTLYVFPNGGPMSWYNYPQFLQGQGEDILVKELIPHLKESYRVREIAIEGFSQGGRGTTRIALQYPEIFSSAAPGGSGYSTEKKVSENGGVESENAIFAEGYNTWDIAATYAKREDKDRLPLLIWVGTKGFNYQNNLEFSTYLDSLEIPHQKLITEGAEHSASQIYEKRRLELMQFHQNHFAPPSP